MTYTLKSAGHSLDDYDDLLCGKFDYHHDADDYYHDYGIINLNSLEDLDELRNLINYDLIIEKDNVILIYDYYLE